MKNEIKEEIARLANWQQASSLWQQTHSIEDDNRHTENLGKFDALNTALKLLTNHQEHFSADLAWNTKISWGILAGVGLLFVTIIGNIFTKII